MEEGTYEHGKFIKGKITLADKTIKVGTFIYDKHNNKLLDGEGIIFNPNNSEIQTGTFKENRFIKGVVIHPNRKTIREGTLNNNIYNGEVIIANDKGIYKQEFHKGKYPGAKVYLNDNEKDLFYKNIVAKIVGAKVYLNDNEKDLLDKEMKKVMPEGITFSQKGTHTNPQEIINDIEEKYGDKKQEINL